MGSLLFIYAGLFAAALYQMVKALITGVSGRPV